MCSLIKWHYSSRCLQDGTRTQLLRLMPKCHVPRYLLAASAPGSRGSPTRFLTLHWKTQCGRSTSCGLFHDVMLFRRMRPSEKGGWRHLLLARSSSRGCVTLREINPCILLFSYLAVDIIIIAFCNLQKRWKLELLGCDENSFTEEKQNKTCIYLHICKTPKTVPIYTIHCRF